MVTFVLVKLLNVATPEIRTLYIIFMDIPNVSPLTLSIGPNGIHISSFYYTIYIFLCFPGLVIMAITVALLHGHGFLLGQKIGMNVRIMMTSAIYKKVKSLEACQ